MERPRTDEKASSRSVDGNFEMLWYHNPFALNILAITVAPL
jgi:hypothetical protein